MGSSNSKTHHQSDDQVRAIRRQIGKRSSVRFLQKADSQLLPSLSKPLSPQVRFPYMLTGPPRPLSSHPPTFPALSPSSTRTVLRAAEGTGATRTEKRTRAPSVLDQRSQATSVSFSSGIDSNSNNEPRCDHKANKHSTCSCHDTSLLRTPSLSDGSSAPEHFDIHDLETDADISLVEYECSEADTPVAKPSARAVTPVLRMFTPLPHDSPTRYGFDRALAVAQAEALEIAQIRGLTGPELFRVSNILRFVHARLTHSQRTADRYHSLEIEELPKAQVPPSTKPRKPRTAGCIPCRTYRPQRSKLSPTELFRRTQSAHHHLPKPQQKESDPRLLRLLRRAWPNNLFRDNPSAPPGVRVALAAPLTPIQSECHNHHSNWRHVSNIPVAVECGVCLRASNFPGDKSGSWLCDYCALRVCSECKAIFDTSGTTAMMARFADGSNTVEGRKAKANRTVPA